MVKPEKQKPRKVNLPGLSGPEGNRPSDNAIERR
jgi:hypothetical protein